MAGGHAFWTTNRVANPVLGRLLRTPLGLELGVGRSPAVARYTGRRTGGPHELIRQYVRDGDRVWILAGQADRTTWWRNLRVSAPVDRWLAGRPARETAVAVVGREDPEECRRGLGAYSMRLPRAGAPLVDDVVVVRAHIG